MHIKSLHIAIIFPVFSVNVYTPTQHVSYYPVHFQAQTHSSHITENTVESILSPVRAIRLTAENVH